MNNYCDSKYNLSVPMLYKFKNEDINNHNITNVIIFDFNIF